MAILSKPTDTGAGHWYLRDGTPFHTVPLKDGSGTRPTRITDARKAAALPSVTNYLSVLAKPGLESWKMTQVALAASRVQRGEGEPEEFWAKRVVAASQEQVSDAADLGTKIHDGIEHVLAGTADYTLDPALAVYVDPVVEWVRKTGITPVAQEVVLVNAREGYAGRCDFLFRWGKDGVGVLDWKTRKTKPGEKVTAYDGQGMQLAAYAAAHWGVEALDDVLIGNGVISTTEPGRFEVIKYDNARALYELFLSVCAVWRGIKGYDPRS